MGYVVLPTEEVMFHNHLMVIDVLPVIQLRMYTMEMVGIGLVRVLMADLLYNVMPQKHNQ